MPGAGDFDLARCASTLATRGFDGAIVLEVLNAKERDRSLLDYARDALSTARAVFSG
jgi:sugar phosphate isomerase/epimerase